MSVYATLMTDVAKLKTRLSTIDLVLRSLPAATNATAPKTVTQVMEAQSSINLAQQLQDLATAKYAYQANAQIMSSADGLLDKLYEIQSDRLRA